MSENELAAVKDFCTSIIQYHSSQRYNSNELEDNIKEIINNLSSGLNENQEELLKNQLERFLNNYSMNTRGTKLKQIEYLNGYYYKLNNEYLPQFYDAIRWGRSR